MKRIMLNAASGAILLAAIAFGAAGCGRSTPTSDASRLSGGSDNAQAELAGTVGGYMRGVYWVELREGFIIDDLKRLDEVSGLLLSSATYKAVGALYVVTFQDPDAGKQNPDDVVARLQVLAPVRGAYKMALYYPTGTTSSTLPVLAPSAK